MSGFSKKGDEVRERILDIAVDVFGRKGFAGAGVREIAREADVNLAMISYYFENKAGLFKAIVNRFFERYRDALQGVYEMDTGDPEAHLKNVVREVVQVLRLHHQEIRLAITEFPLEIHDLRDMRAERIREVVFPVLNSVLDHMSEQLRKRPRLEIIGPTVGGTILFHFIMRPVIQRVFETEFDDQFYEDFADELTEFLMYGMFGRPPVNEKEEKGD